MTADALDSSDPLYVDLDGTLISSDLLWESLARLPHQRPRDVLRLPFWLTRGRAAFKRQLAERISIDPASLPYRPEVLAYIEEARRSGRRVVLATASDLRFAEQIADHLGVFDGVLASDGECNLKGLEKLRAIETHSGGSPFEYLGNSRADLPLWRSSALSTVVAPSRTVERGLAQLTSPTHSLQSPRPQARLAVIVRALRPHQWVKNGLLFVPILLAHELSDLAGLLSVAIAFATFCAIASAGYLLNDLFDIDADRRHPQKRWRPFAAGTLSIPGGIALCAALLALGFGLSLALLSPGSTGMLAAYAILTTAYSYQLKEQLFIDVLVLAGLYTHRVLSGAVAGQVDVSPWLLAFSMFFFISLAFVKRYSELRTTRDANDDKLHRRAYEVGDLELVQSMGLTSGYISVLVLGLFVSSDRVRELYATPEVLWLISPIMLYWISRMWFLARRGELPADPVLFAATDRQSYVVGGLIVLVGVLATLVK